MQVDRRGRAARPARAVVAAPAWPVTHLNTRLPGVARRHGCGCLAGQRPSLGQARRRGTSARGDARKPQRAEEGALRKAAMSSRVVVYPLNAQRHALLRTLGKIPKFAPLPHRRSLPTASPGGWPARCACAGGRHERPVLCSARRHPGVGAHPTVSCSAQGAR